MPVNGFPSLKVDRPGVQPGFQQPEGVLYLPKVVVDAIDFALRRVYFARDDEVVPGAFQVLVDLPLVDDDTRLLAVPADESDVFGRLAVFLPLRLRMAQSLGLLHQPADLRPFFAGQGRVVRGHPLLPDADDRLLAAFAGHFDREVVHAFLYSVQEVPVAVLDVFVLAVEQYPIPFLLLQLQHRLGEDVAVFVQQGIVDVVAAIEAFVRDLDGFARDAAPLFHLLDELPDLGLLAFVARVHPHAQRDGIPVEQERLADDGAGPVFLRRALLPVARLEVDLEVVIGAVEIGVRDVPAEFFAYGVVQRLDEFAVFPADVVEAVVDLVQGKAVFLIEVRQDFAERPQLAARLHDPGVGEGLDEPGDGIGEAVHVLEGIQLLLELQRVEQVLDDEIAEVPRRLLPDPPRFRLFELFGPLRVQPLHLFPVVGDGIGDSARRQIGEVAEGLVASVPARLGLLVVVALVDLQIHPAGGRGFFQEIRHGSVRSLIMTKSL